ncbi:hypothetical protein [Parasitella parasitica]|uniref:Phosphatidate phosphatase APP1 catalytic domain-containing protein n=1 Tax=Parasitella parasitica TaxID=35722 RepID=A0A0B7NXI8_9FUNG|nr:hypothetical protein [Parasitella parasitica]
MESRKRVATSPTLASKPKQRKTAPPAIVGTKASMARAKAVNAQLAENKSRLPRRKKPEEPKSLAKSFKTTAAGLKERPAWDLRGKVADMTNMFEMNKQRLDELHKFKRELEITKDEKESQEKEALQKAAALRTELQELERNHTINIEELNANQRIEYQRLEDDSLNHSRRLASIEVEVGDAKRRLNVEVKQLDQIKEENEALKTSIEITSNEFQNLDNENRTLDSDIKKLQESLQSREAEVESKHSKLEQINDSVQILESKLSSANADRERLLNKIRDLEIKKKITAMHKPSLKHYHFPTKSSLPMASNATANSITQSSALSVNTKAHCSVHRECILFPTYAFRDLSNLDEWVVRTKGWALSLKKPGPKQRVLKGITKSVAGKGSATHENANKMFENRFKYFMAKGKRNKRIEIEAIGAATNAEWIQICNNHSLQSPSTPQDDLSDFQLPLEKTSPQWQKICNAAKPHMDHTSIVIHDDDVNPLPIILNTPYPLTFMASNVNHHGTNTSSDEDDEERISSCHDTTTCSPLIENGITLESEGTGVFEGEFRLPEKQVDAWTHTSNDTAEDERMIKIRSQSKSDFSAKKGFCFPPSYGIVQLIEPYGVSVISDIDDTIKDTRVLSGARTVLSNTFFNPTRAVPGMADAYLQWYNQGASYHYVSNSPYQLVHMLHQFINNHQFPPGSFHLRPSTGIISKLVQESGRSKRKSICKILRDFPRRKFVLVGDSGEIDLEIYTKIAIEFPGQIIKIFIRDITTNHCHHHRPNESKKRRRMRNKRSLTFPALFTSNLSAAGQRTESSPDLSSTIMGHDDNTTTISTDYEDDTDEEYLDDDEDKEEDDTASKLAELILEPSLTGHQPLDIASSLRPSAIKIQDHTAADGQPPAPSQSLMQLFTRLAIARRAVKDVDIALFKDSKELYQDEKVMYALAKHKNSKEQ